MRAELRSLPSEKFLAADRRMLFPFRLRKRKAVLACELAGHETQHHRRRLTFKNVCDDRLARGLCAGTRGADYRDDQVAEPVHVESDFDRAIRGARSADR